MWLVLVGVISLSFGVLALVGLLAVAKELFFDSPPDAGLTNAGTTGRQGVGGRDSARRCVAMR